MQKNESYIKGKNFENYVASLYESLGFAVKKNQFINGQQVDIIIEKNYFGIGKLIFYIECKYLFKGNVSNQIIHDFASFILNAKQSYSFDKGIIVTNNAFSKEAYSVNTNGNVLLLTISELENELFNLKDSYQTIINEYKQKPIFNNYIPLDFTIDSDASPRIKENIERTIRYCYWDKITFIFILADYGSGKTTLLERLLFKYSEDYIKGENRKKPFYLELKYFHLFPDLDSFLSASYRKLFNQDIPLSLLKIEISNGGFTFLLDGLDEMSTQSDMEIRIQNLIKLSPILFSKSNTIITCRQSHFVSSTEFLNAINNIKESYTPIEFKKDKSNLKKIETDLYNRLLKKYSFKNILTEPKKIDSKIFTFFLQKFSDEQINVYLRKFNDKFINKCKVDWIEIKRFLLSIYDIKDLMTKPILLMMIKDTILELGVNYNQKQVLSDPSSLYKLYTSLIFQIDWEKGDIRKFLTISQRKEFATAIALAMFDNNTLDVSYSEISGIILSETELNTTLTDKIHNYEQIAADIQICCFITRQSSDLFRFIHKSFMEYFVADYLRKKLSSTYIDIRFYNAKISDEILLFIGAFASRKENLLKFIKQWNSKRKYPKTSLLKRNLSTAYLLHKNDFNDELFTNIDYVDSIFKNIYFSNSTFENIDFKNCSLLKISFINCKLNIAVNDSTLNTINLKSTELNIFMLNSKLTLSSINNCKGILNCNNSEMNNLNISSSELIFKNIAGFYLTEIKTCNLQINSNLQVKFQNSTLLDSIFKGIFQINKLSLNNKFESCLFMGQTCDGNLFEKTSNNLFINCRGILFYQLDENIQIFNKEVNENKKYDIINKKNIFLINFDNNGIGNINDLFFIPIKLVKKVPFIDYNNFNQKFFYKNINSLLTASIVKDHLKN